MRDYTLSKQSVEQMRPSR